ncbi:citrate synthase family protein [uncultured Massilia sp.]|uniref:citrate synthase family protein n=1 Tax=uncultured Massilia sp. TaxID=169973 RepID=UPI0025CFA584|nr:citrate synthase family protein [uncultured Massilia sp.]
MNDDLSAPEAAAILGISVATLYSYVSRGLLTAVGPAGARGKRYPREPVLRLAARKADGKRGGHLAEASMHWGVPVLETCISRIDEGRLYYRGHEVVVLAAEASLEDVACLLWNHARHDYFGDTSPALPTGPFDSLRAVTGAIGPLERAMAWLPVLGHGLATPTHDVDAILRQGPVLMRLLAGALLGTTLSSLPLHQQIGRAWDATPAECDLIRAALVILAEHELNASTFTVRCAASTGASLAATLGAGLAALSGPKHGGSIQSVKAMLDTALAAPSPAQVVAGHFPADGSAPNGYTHPLYPDGDPRASFLLERLSPLSSTVPEASAIIALGIDEGARRGMSPNLDLALSAMQLVFGWPDAAPLILFALARSAGWIAHAAEQIAEDALIRPRARYVGRF